MVADLAGRFANPESISQLFRRVQRGLPDLTRIRLHDVRHTQASLLIMDGVPVRPSDHERAAVPVCSLSASNPLGGARVRESRARPFFRFRLGAAGVRAHS